MAIDEFEDLPILSHPETQSFGDAAWKMRTAARRFIENIGFPEPNAWSFIMLTQGLSGGSVVRCSHPEGEFALKLWPETTAENRLDEIHRVQQFSGKSLCLVPELIPWRDKQTRLTIENASFDFARWKRGQEFNGDQSELFSAVNRGAAAIAKFHQSTVALSTENAIAPAVFQRIERLSQLGVILPDAIEATVLHRKSIKQAGEYLAAKWRYHHQKGENIFREWATRAVPLQWVLRDIHREHVLFDQGEVTGIVDFDAIRRDTVSTDLARWVGSFADLTLAQDRLWSEAFSGYQSIRPISPCEQRLASAIEKASRYIQLANWVVWVAAEKRNFPCGPEVIDCRVNRLLRICSTE